MTDAPYVNSGFYQKESAYLIESERERILRHFIEFSTILQTLHSIRELLCVRNGFVGE